MYRIDNSAGSVASPVTRQSQQHSQQQLQTLASLDLQWGGASYPGYVLGMNTAGTPAAAAGAASTPAANTPTGLGVPGASPTPAAPQGASATPQGAQGGTPAAAQGGGNEENLAVLRRNYETYRQIGEPERVQSISGAYQRAYQQVVELATPLGYTETELQAAFDDDPVGTLDFLRERAQSGQGGQRGQAQGNGQGDGQGQGQGQGQGTLQEQVQRALNEALKPIRAHQQQQLQQAASNRFDAEFESALQQAFPGIALPDDEANLVYEATAQLMGADKKAMQALMQKGDASHVRQYFDRAKNMLDKYYLARTGREGQRIAGQSAQGQGTGGQGEQQNNHSLDDLINNPGLINPKYA